MSHEWAKVDVGFCLGNNNLGNCCPQQLAWLMLTILVEITRVGQKVDGGLVVLDGNNATGQGCNFQTRWGKVSI